MSAADRFSKKWLLLLIPAAFALLLLVIAVYIYFWPQRIEDRIRKSVTEALADRFRSDADLKTLHIRVFASPNVTGEGLALYYHGRKDVAPLIQIEKFSFTVGHRRASAPRETHLANPRAKHVNHDPASRKQ